MAGSLADEYTPVCMSYTLAMKWCCNKLGIQCEIIFGNAGELHAWNIINYGDNVDYSAAEPVYDTTDWYEMDVTWDDPVGPGESYIGRDYFNVTTEYMKKSRTRLYTYYKEYPVENCTGIELSWDKIKNDF